MAEPAEPIEMSFGLWVWVGRRKQVLHGDTLAQPGGYDWTVCVLRRWALCQITL